MKIKFLVKLVVSLVLLSLIVYLIYLTVLFMFSRPVDYSEMIYNPVELLDPEEKISECTIDSSISFVKYSEETWDKNNKYGMYVYAENKDFIKLGEKFVNSNDGEWGYLLFPYNIKDRDFQKWNYVFTFLKENKVIPIIQLWDVDPDNFENDTKNAAAFLDQFVWPIKPRYISVYNETNDAKFWRGKVDPENYAKVLDFTIETFKSKNKDFFMMNGAFNVSAPTNDQYLNAFTYMRRMNSHIPGIFNKLDGWASHPYPQPNFSESPKDTGVWSIRAYEDELSFLQQELNLTKDLPVFITETGWAHAEGENYNSSFLPVKNVAEYYKYAFENVWLPDDRVRAVIPFTIWFDPPFDHFAFLNKDKVPYYHYEYLKKLDKVEGNPPRLLEVSQKSLRCL
jgi:hypothetical protein